MQTPSGPSSRHSPPGLPGGAGLAGGGAADGTGDGVADGGDEAGDDGPAGPVPAPVPVVAADAVRRPVTEGWVPAGTLAPLPGTGSRGPAAQRAPRPAAQGGGQVRWPRRRQ